MMEWDWRLRTAASTGLSFIPGWLMRAMVWWCRLGLTSNLATRVLWQPPALSGSPVSSEIFTASSRMDEGNENIVHSSLTRHTRLCLMQVYRWRHSVSDVVEYVTTEKVTRIYFQHISCVHTPVGNSNTLGLYWLITSYFEAFFLKERMNISDNLHKLKISHRISFSHYKQNTCLSQIQDGCKSFSTLILKIGTTSLTAPIRKTEATPRSAEQLPK
jgi:hypothetical protein